MKIKLLLAGLLAVLSVKGQEQRVRVEIKPGIALFDGSRVSPGDTIFLISGKWRNLKLKNIRGLQDKPIIIINSGGLVSIGNDDFYYAVAIENSRFFRLTGAGDEANEYGVAITGTQRGSGLGLRLCSDFEIDHLEIRGTDFAGISAKTDPSCDTMTWRRNFLMTNISIHDNYIHDTGGEGMYIGSNKTTINCDNKVSKISPHEIRHIRVYKNIIENTGWDGLQVSQASEDCEIYLNTISNYGVSRKKFQDCGLVIGGGTTGKVFSNRIVNGSGPGIMVFGMGENYIYNNLIYNAGTDGVFINDRETVKPGWGFHLLHNNIINPKRDGIRMYSDESTGNEFCNNVIINPGSFELYDKYDSMKGTMSFIFVIKDRHVQYEASNNYFGTDISKVGFIDAEKMDFNLSKDSALRDRGKDFTKAGVLFDFANNKRYSGAVPDIGMFEFQDR